MFFNSIVDFGSLKNYGGELLVVPQMIVYVLSFSPKRSRRDGKPEAERVLSKKDLDVRDVSTETDKKPRQSLRDAAPLEPDAQGLSKDGEKKHSGLHETTKQASHLSEGPRSRPYHQVREA